jgi:hypothetical protein
MNDHPNAVSGCLMVAEYVDEGEIPKGLTFHAGEVIRPQVISEYLDVCLTNNAHGDEILQTLLQAVRTETDGPSRAKMVEVLARLEAVRAMRNAWGRKPEFPSDLCCRIVELFNPEIIMHRDDTLNGIREPEKGSRNEERDKLLALMQHLIEMVRDLKDRKE